MMSKKIKNVISLIIFLVLLVFIIYYFWPKDNGMPPEDKQANFFEFVIAREDLSNWDKEKSAQDFLEIKESLEADPDQLNGWLSLALLKKHVGDYRGAEEAWIKAGEVRPKNSTSFGNLADLYVNFTQEYDKAEVVYRTAIENSIKETTSIQYYRNYHFFLLEKLNDEERAEEILLEGIARKPGSNLLYLLGNFYKERNNTDKAKEYYEEYLEAHPDSDKVQQLLDEL